MSKAKTAKTRIGIDLDPSVAQALAAPPAHAKTARQSAAPKRSKATYDLSPETIQAVRELAAELDVPIATVVEKLLTYGLTEYRAGRLQLRRRPVVKWDLE